MLQSFFYWKIKKKQVWTKLIFLTQWCFKFKGWAADCIYSSHSLIVPHLCCIFSNLQIKFHFHKALQSLFWPSMKAITFDLSTNILSSLLYIPFGIFLDLYYVLKATIFACHTWIFDISISGVLLTPNNKRLDP